MSLVNTINTGQEDMSECVGKATKPLLRQIETLQSSLRQGGIFFNGIQ